jgi:trans-2,3-dihydro-3-hydroxyanthranilate isomerase
MALDYILVDVFTDHAFGGNPLAVFPNGRSVPPELMPKIARELNLSETTFVLPAKDSANDFWVRIFTPTKELPMAGHPTIGTAFVLARERFIDVAEDMDDFSENVIFEEGVGPVPVTLDFLDGELNMITMEQPLPQFEGEITDRAGVAAMLSLSESDLADYPVEMVTCGVPFTIVPLRSMEVVRKAVARPDLIEAISAAPEVYLFTAETDQPGTKVRSRMFAPTFGIAEDPATGAAGGPLGCYLVKHGLAGANGVAQIICEQGFEMGRPSILHITIDYDETDFTRVRVGGQCVMVGRGSLNIG